VNTDDISCYLTPEESAAASIDGTDKALGWVIGQLTLSYLKARNLREQLVQTNDDDKIGELEWQLKLIRQEESSLHRIESGLQSRLKLGQ